jgi:hypothetical protein
VVRGRAGLATPLAAGFAVLPPGRDRGGYRRAVVEDAHTLRPCLDGEPSSGRCASSGEPVRKGDERVAAAVGGQRHAIGAFDGLAGRERA